MSDQTSPAMTLLDTYYATPDDRPAGYWDSLTQPAPLPRHPRHRRGRTAQRWVMLTDDERQALTPLARRPMVPQWRARAARLLLLLDEGLPITHVAHDVGVSRRCVYRWIARYQAHGLAAVQPCSKGVNA